LHHHAARRRRHFHAVTMTIEQLGAQPTFERLDSAADRGLLRVKLRRSGAETSGFCDGEEKPHIVPVAENIRHLALSRRSRNHSNNRYNVLAAQTFTSHGPLWFILHHC
jgi:hypothetical protein